MKRNMYGAMNINYKSLIITVSLFFALSASISAAPGDLDPTFGNGGIVVGSGGYAQGMALQADGKIVAVGYGATAGGSSWDFAVARYNTDGSPDTSFGGSGVVVTPLSNCNDYALSVAIQGDGKIVVAGFIVNYAQGMPCDGGGNNFAVARYNPNGTLDTTFNGTGKVITQINASNYARSVAIQTDGKIVVAGESYDSSTGGTTLVRYNTNGSLDTSFDNDGIVVTTGVGGAYAVAIQADGKIVAAGYGVIRYNADGSLDTTFNGTGIVTTPDSGAYAVAIQADGKILTTNGTNGFSGNRLVRYNANGTPDTSFNGTGSVAVGIGVSSAVVQADGKIVAAGYTQFGEGSAFAVIRLNGNGSLDATFGGTGTVITPIVTEVYYSSFANAVAIQPDGKIVAAGGVVDSFDLFDFALVRYQGDSISPTSCPNPIDCAEFFVRQHYRDFLGREAESIGLQDWQRVLANCPSSDLECFHQARLTVSASFFGSPEFQLKGYFAFRFYRAALNRLPLYAEIIADMQSLNGQSPTEVYANRAAFTNSFGQRPEFLNRFASLSNADYVAALLNQYGLTSVRTPDPLQPQDSNKLTLSQVELVARLDAALLTRAQVLRAIADSDEVFQIEFNRAFVAMQYYGYLRRTPEPDGYDAWLNYLNAHPTDFREMVRGFMDSIEYRRRFGSE